MTMRRLLLSLLPALASAVTGHGPRGVHPVDSRYIAVADSSLDAVLIVDGSAGGAVVGHVVLHDRKDDANRDGWLNPVSLASCDECKHVFVLSGKMLYAIALDKPLLEMAAARDFSALSKSIVRPFWPTNWSEKYRGDGYLRSVSVASDGSSAYVAHARGGIFGFDPMNPTDANRRAKHVLKAGDADIQGDIASLHHTSSLKNLVVTRGKYVHIVKIRDDDGNNPLDMGQPLAYELALDYHCKKHYKGAEMNFVDSVIIGNYAFVMGQVRSSGSRHSGVEIFRLTWYDDDEAWHDCYPMAGSSARDAGWEDGAGYDTAFSATPHDMAVLPASEEEIDGTEEEGVVPRHVLVVGDVDNRALRYVDVTVPIETHDQTDRVRVTSVAYDEDLYQVLYSDQAPWNALAPEDVMAQDGKSYYHSGQDALYAMTFAAAQEECGRVGIGRICTLPEIRARFARGQYPTLEGNDGAWTTVWMAEDCAGCHLEDPGKCPLGGDSPDGWGEDHKMIAVFNPKQGLQVQCVPQEAEVDTMSMCCGLGGPAVLNPQTASAGSSEAAAAAAAQQKKAGAISAGVIVPMLLLAVAAYGLYMRKRAKPAWWPQFLRDDRREVEETGHAPHREVDLRGRDYI